MKNFLQKFPPAKPTPDPLLESLITELQTEQAYLQYVDAQPNVVPLRPESRDEHAAALYCLQLIRDGKFDELQQFLEGGEPR